MTKDELFKENLEFSAYIQKDKTYSKLEDTIALSTSVVNIFLVFLIGRLFFNNAFISCVIFLFITVMLNFFLFRILTVIMYFGLEELNISMKKVIRHRLQYLITISIMFFPILLITVFFTYF